MIAHLDRLRSHWGHLPAAASGSLQLLCAAGLALSAIASATAGQALSGLALTLVAAALGLGGARSLGSWRAAGARARSRRAAAKELRALAGAGWSLRHGLSWPGGRIEHLLVSPDDRLSFIVCSPGAAPREAELAELASRARWLGHQGRRPCIAVCALPPALCAEDQLEAGILLTPLPSLVGSLAAAHERFAADTRGVG